MWTSVFISGDPDAYKTARYVLWTSIRNAKRDYRDKVQSNYQELWSKEHVERTTLHYKKEVSVLPITSITEELNTIYACFDADNKERVTCPQVCRKVATLILQTAEILRSPTDQTGPRRPPSSWRHTSPSPIWRKGIHVWGYSLMITVQHSVPSSLINWSPGLMILDWRHSFADRFSAFWWGRPQVVIFGSHTSSSLILNTGAPQGCVLSPHWYYLFSHAPVSSSTSTQSLTLTLMKLHAERKWRLTS